jgi:hypothetical protein
MVSIDGQAGHGQATDHEHLSHWQAIHGQALSLFEGNHSQPNSL